MPGFKGCGLAVKVKETGDYWLIETYPRCTCEWEFKSLGRQDGISMGKGWVRLNTDPDCPHH